MSLVSICIVLAALLLVTSLVVCGFLYFSFVSVSTNIIEEDTCILIDSDDSVVSSICKEVLLHESGGWKKTFENRSKSFTAGTSHHCNLPPQHHENVVDKEKQLKEGHTRDKYDDNDDDDVMINNLNSVTTANFITNNDNSSRTYPAESVKLIPLLEELPLESSSFC